MNIIEKKFAEAFQIKTVIKKADQLLANKPVGFHPNAKKAYRRDCKDVLDSLTFLTERKRSARIIGNKSISNGTKLRIEQLKNIAK